MEIPDLLRPIPTDYGRRLNRRIDLRFIISSPRIVDSGPSGSRDSRLMRFRLAVQAVARKRSRLFSMAKSPLPEPELHGLARQIGRLCLHEPEAPASLNQLKADFLRAASENTLSQVPARMWDRLPMVLEYGEGPLLGTDPGVIAGLARYLSERRAHRCVRNLASYYFREFQA